MDKSPSDDEQYVDDERDGDETQGISHTRPRRSVVPQRSSAKQRSDFYFDEHPEIPKIRRASLNLSKSRSVPSHDSQSVSGNPELEETTRPHSRYTLQQGWREKAAFTGLDVNDVREAKTAKQKRPDQYTQPSYKASPHTSEHRSPVYRPARPRQNSTTAERYPRVSSRASGPLGLRRKSWLLIGLLALLILLAGPFLANFLHNTTATTVRASNGTSSSAPKPGNFSTNVQKSNAHILIITPPDVSHPAPPVYATSAYLLDTDNGTTLYAQNPFLHLPMLSTTKLMTALLTVETGNLEQKVTVTAAMQRDINKLSADSALFGVKQGQTYTLRDILYGLLYVSGNDAALIIADDLAGNVTKFVAEMNQKAQQLGLYDTHFVNPHGLLAAGQYSCAHDLALLGNESLNNPVIRQISSGKVYHIAAAGKHDARILLNENQFLWWYPGVDAGKTGYDGVTDFIQVMSVTRNHTHMIGVVMNTDDWWTDMRDLMDYGSDDYTWISPRDVDASGQPIPFDTLWNYFATDTPQSSISVGKQSTYYILTGYTVSGSILSYFNHNGGLKHFGYPVAMPVSTGGELMSQKFQHATVECDFSNNVCRAI